MVRSLKRWWYLWFFDLPRDMSWAEVEAVARCLDTRLQTHARWLGNAMALTVGGGGALGGAFFNAWPAGWLMALGLHRTIAYMIGAACAALIGCLLGGIAMYLVALVLGRRAWIVEARRAVRDTGREVCVRCGYWLRGLGDEVRVCPECGTEREAMV